jgi:hypothetical protein
MPGMMIDVAEYLDMRGMTSIVRGYHSICYFPCKIQINSLVSQGAVKLKEDAKWKREES